MSLASLIRSGLIWRALPNEQEFTPCSQAHCAELNELCFEQLRQASAKEALPFGIEQIDRALPTGGLACSTVHEWFLINPPYKQRLIPHSIFSWFAFQAWQTIALKSQRYIFWIGKETWPVPHTLAQISAAAKQQRDDFFARNIFINVVGEKERLWSIETALRSPATALVIAPLSSTSLAISRRLLLAAEHGASIGLFAISHQLRQTTTSAQSRWQLSALPTTSNYARWQLEIIKWKGAAPFERSWEVELSPPSVEEFYFSGAHHEQSNAAFSLHIPADRIERDRVERTTREARAQ